MNEERKRIIEMLKQVKPGTDEYNNLLNSLEQLDRITSKRFDSTNPAVLSAAVSLIQVILVLNYERLGIVTSRAMSFIKK